MYVLRLIGLALKGDVSSSLASDSSSVSKQMFQRGSSWLFLTIFWVVEAGLVSSPLWVFSHPLDDRSDQNLRRCRSTMAWLYVNPHVVSLYVTLCTSLLANAHFVHITVNRNFYVQSLGLCPFSAPNCVMRTYVNLFVCLSVRWPIVVARVLFFYSVTKKLASSEEQSPTRTQLTPRPKLPSPSTWASFFINSS